MPPESGKNIAGKMEIPKRAKKSSSMETRMFIVVRNKKVLETFHGRAAAEAYARSCDRVIETDKPVKKGARWSKCL